MKNTRSFGAFRSAAEVRGDFVSVEKGGFPDLEDQICDLDHMADVLGTIIGQLLDETVNYKQVLTREGTETAFFCIYQLQGMTQKLRSDFNEAFETYQNTKVS